MSGLVDVALPLPFQAPFTYRLPAGEAVPDRGVRVVVPFGSRRVIGVVTGPARAREGLALKDVVQVLDEGPLVPPPLLDLAAWIADHYLAPPGECYRLVMPPAGVRASKAVVTLARAQETGNNEIVDWLRERALPVSTIARRLGRDPSARLSRLRREGSAHSADELKLIVTASRRLGLLPEAEEEMIHHALELANLTVRQIMVPRNNIFSLSADMPLEEAMARVVEEQHSRVPVYDPQKGKENIVGLLYSKDLSRVMHMRLAAGQHGGQRSSGLKVRHLMRDVLFIPESKPVADLLTEFQRRKRHLAVVVDEFGSTSGLVTVEDVLEQLVGELEDEFDIAQRPAASLESGAVILDGSSNVRDLEVQYDISLPHDQGFETLAGFVLAQLGRIPRGGEAFEHDGRRYTVVQMDSHRIARVRIESTHQPSSLEPAS